MVQTASHPGWAAAERLVMLMLVSPSSYFTKEPTISALTAARASGKPTPTGVIVGLLAVYIVKERYPALIQCNDALAYELFRRLFPSSAPPGATVRKEVGPFIRDHLGTLFLKAARKCVQHQEQQQTLKGEHTNV